MEDDRTRAARRSRLRRNGIAAFVGGLCLGCLAYVVLEGWLSTLAFLLGGLCFAYGKYQMDMRHASST